MAADAEGENATKDDDPPPPPSPDVIQPIAVCTRLQKGIHNPK
jgi:hypothetical protein